MKPLLSIFNYQVKNQGAGTLDVYIDGAIVDAETQEFYREYWGDETSVSYKSFRNQVEQANPQILNLTVNSPGGHVGDALAIHDYMVSLEEKGVTVNRQGIGIVASAATYLVMGKNSTLSKNAMFMIHEVSGIAYGNVTEIENMARALRKFNDKAIEFYVQETGLSTTVIGNMMKAETWMTAQEAKDKAFIKNVTGDAVVTNSIKNEHWQFRNTAVLNAYNSSITKTQNIPEMDLTKFQEAIENGFKNALQKMGFKNENTDNPDFKTALTEYSTGIVDSIKELIPTEEAIGEMVNKAMSGEVFTNALATAVTNQFKIVPTNITEAITNAVTEGTKDLVPTNKLKEVTDKLDKVANELGDVKTDVSNAAGGGAKPDGGKRGNVSEAENNYEKHPGVGWRQV